MTLIDRLQGLLAAGRDGAHIRVSLAQACMGRGDGRDAVGHLEQALRLEPGYSAAWKAYGRALVMERRTDEARTAYRRGIEAARQAGDRQSEREMQVFLRRLEKGAAT